MKYADRITFDPEQCGGRPCIRHYRLRVKDVLDLLVAAVPENEILEDEKNQTEQSAPHRCPLCSDQMKITQAIPFQRILVESEALNELSSQPAIRLNRNRPRFSRNIIR